ncbi:CCDC115 [Scenedesmus sp. PABB004]|nr:CCDC115 [Scenedesmus sp. PABB004]
MPPPAAPAPRSEAAFFAALQALDDFLVAQEDLAASLKAGHLALARSKYALGASLGQQRYPGAAAASATLRLLPPDDPDGLYDGFELSQLQEQEQEEPQQEESQLRQRKAPQQQEEPQQQQEPQQQSQQAQKPPAQPDPVTWFCALPPAPVRQAQAEFRSALACAVAAANAAQRLRAHADVLALVGAAEGDAGSDAG